MAAIFADNICKCIFLNENVWILIKISRIYVPKGLINNVPAFVFITAWCRPGDKPLSEPMMFSLLTHICVTRPQWVNWSFRKKLQWNLNQSSIFYTKKKKKKKLNVSSVKWQPFCLCLCVLMYIVVDIFKHQHNTVYSQYIVVVYITELDRLWLHFGPHFSPCLFVNFALWDMGLVYCSEEWWICIGTLYHSSGLKWHTLFDITLVKFVQLIQLLVYLL